MKIFTFWLFVFWIFSSFCKPHLTLSSLYPSEFLMQKITEDNQIPVHLHVSVSLQYVAGLKGRALVEFFHSNIAEVPRLSQVYRNVLCDLCVLHSIQLCWSNLATRVRLWETWKPFDQKSVSYSILGSLLQQLGSYKAHFAFRICGAEQESTSVSVLKIWLLQEYSSFL